ncbi:MAG TPA: hypothetical protein DCO77_11185 [Nitrospiraceae bacterium]|nr:hypothetical protein [Nitrospiraceae bacterium]
MAQEKSIKKKALIVAAAVLAIIVIASLVLYGYFFYLPKKQFKEVLVEFESASRKEHTAKLQAMISKRSVLQLFLGKGLLRKSFRKFERETVIVTAYLTREPREGGMVRFPYITSKLNDESRIVGSFRKRARKDGNYREPFRAEMVYEEGRWKLLRFSFPEVIDY